MATHWRARSEYFTFMHELTDLSLTKFKDHIRLYFTEFKVSRFYRSFAYSFMLVNKNVYFVRVKVII